MEHGGFYNSKQSCKAGPSEPVAILGSECHVTINRNGSNVAHHTGIWFVDEKTEAASGLKCGASPKDEKAAVVKAGGPALVSSPGVSVRRKDVVREGARVHLAQRSG